MELVPAGAPLSFEVTYDSPSLNVGMSVYDSDGDLVSGPTAMANIVGTNTYQGSFTPVGGNYTIVKAVYTDNTLAVLNSNYSAGSESIFAQNLSAGQATGCSVVGYVNINQTIVGYVNCD